MPVEEEICVDRHVCTVLDLEAWFANLEENRSKKSTVAKCREISQSAKAVDKEGSGKPIYSIVDCNSEGAIWTYMYVKSFAQTMSKNLNTSTSNYVSVSVQEAVYTCDCVQFRVRFSA
jgi:hypothetical protein